MAWVVLSNPFVVMRLDEHERMVRNGLITSGEARQLDYLRNAVRIGEVLRSVG